MKISLIIPVYYNEENLRPLYADLEEKFVEKIDCDYEIVMVNDGSKDASYEVMKELADKTKAITVEQDRRKTNVLQVFEMLMTTFPKMKVILPGGVR